MWHFSPLEWCRFYKHLVPNLWLPVLLQCVQALGAAVPTTLLFSVMFPLTSEMGGRGSPKTNMSKETKPEQQQKMLLYIIQLRQAALEKLKGDVEKLWSDRQEGCLGTATLIAAAESTSPANSLFTI